MARDIKVNRRSVINVGGSYGITMPKSFAERNGLKFGDEVGIVANGGVVLIVVPRNPKAGVVEESNEG